jgi:hypothetical protein
MCIKNIFKEIRTNFPEYIDQTKPNLSKDKSGRFAGKNKPILFYNKNSIIKIFLIYSVNQRSVKLICRRKDCRGMDCRWMDCRWMDCRWMDCRWMDCRWMDCRWMDCRWMDCRWMDCRWIDCWWIDCRWVDCRWIDCRWIERDPCICLTVIYKPKSDARRLNIISENKFSTHQNVCLIGNNISF